ncbi:sensor histidine kinase [Janthinobacterium agaricidamnosum]|uniref:sensor histidine kinase n=1 Tax=Janthinobacterium agaricidamnosum TaxID=55508 RepID=UPI0030DC459A
MHIDAQRAADLSELLGHVNTSWDDERRSLSRQLHDSLGSSLTALSMHLSLLAQKMPQEQALIDRTAVMKQLLANVIETNRQMQLKLWNDKLEFLGVNVALSELSIQFAEQQHIAVRCSLPEDELVCPRNYGVALLRTLEEALSNIAAHAQASEVDIIVDDNDEALTLTVKDNGVGMPAQQEASATGKHGLRSVRERVQYLGGALSLQAGPDGRGTTLTVTLPRKSS